MRNGCGRSSGRSDFACSHRERRWCVWCSADFSCGNKVVLGISIFERNKDARFVFARVGLTKEKTAAALSLSSSVDFLLDQIERQRIDLLNFHISIHTLWCNPTRYPRLSFHFFFSLSISSRTRLADMSKSRPSSSLIRSLWHFRLIKNKKAHTRTKIWHFSLAFRRWSLWLCRHLARFRRDWWFSFKTFSHRGSFQWPSRLLLDQFSPVFFIRRLVS